MIDARAPFDLQAHRGGAGLRAENTLEAFGAALDLGVSTLELDVHLTADDQVVVSHDRVVAPGSPLSGCRIRELTLAEVRTIDVGSIRAEEFLGRPLLTGARIPTLQEVYDLLRLRRADPVWVNLEVKHDVLAPSAGAERSHFVATVLKAVHDSGRADRTSVQAFDWEVLELVRAADPGIRLHVLASDKYLQPGRDGASPWLGGLDVDDLPGGFLEGAAARGFDAISPIHGSPYLGGVDDPAYVAFVDAAMVDAAHARGLEVIPYVVDDVATMRALVRLGVDGLITNYPDRLRRVLDEEGLALPPAFPG